MPSHAGRPVSPATLTVGFRVQLRAGTDKIKIRQAFRRGIAPRELLEGHLTELTQRFASLPDTFSDACSVALAPAILHVDRMTKV